MASLTPIYVWRSGGGYGLRYILFVVKDADTNDTVTVSELTKVEDTVGIKMDDGTALTCTEATNVVTIGTAAMTDEDCLILVSGS